MGRRLSALLSVLLAALLSVSVAAVPASAAEASAFSVLMLTPSERDDPAVVRAELAVGIMSRTYGFRVDVVHDASAFTTTKLADYQVVLWAGVHGDVLGSAGEQALEAYVTGGGGFAGVMGTTVNAEPAWEWYDELVGTRVKPGTGQDVKHDVSVSAGTPTASGSESASRQFELTDRWYEPMTDPATLPGFTSVASYKQDGGIDVSTGWTHLQGDGRVMLTSMGNGYDTWGEGDFTKLVRDQLWWASGSTAPILVLTDNAAPPWPYVVSFVLWILAIVLGGVSAVSRSSRESVRG